MKKMLPFIVLFHLVLSIDIADAQSSNLPGAGWRSGVQVQNLGNTPALIEVNAIDTNGINYACGSDTVAPGASANFQVDTDCNVPAEFVGSAVVSANQPVAAIVNVHNKAISSAAGQFRGTSGNNVAQTIYFPLIKNNHNGRTTTLYVQNASTGKNDIQATFVVQGQTYIKTFYDVPANAMVVVIPGQVGVPAGPGSFGSATISGTRPLAGTSLEHEHGAAAGQNLQASTAFTPNDGSSTAFCPLVRNAHTSKRQTTGVQVQNISGSSQTITIEYSTGQTNSAYIADGASHNFYTPFDLPVGELASATLTGSGSMFAIVNDKGSNTSNPQRVTSYSCFGRGATTVHLPLYKENFGANPVNTTGIQVQNVSDSATRIKVTYMTNRGDTVVVETDGLIDPGDSQNFYGISIGATPGVSIVSGTRAQLANTFGGAVVTAAQAIVAIANESSVGGSPVQDTKNYEGF